MSKGVCDLYLPNAFTPNKDGLSDIFKMKYPFAVRNFSFTIFNRWEEKVLKRLACKKGDGLFNGTDQNTGAYVWMISFIDNDNVKKFAKCRYKRLR
jgi:gliding motility-associated-like protein